MSPDKEISLPLPADRYIHRDISWLAFNERVLQEAENKENPLFERIKFMAIYSNNLDEFFRVRVANQRNLLRLGKKTKARLDFDPKEIMKMIRSIVNSQQLRYTRLFEEDLIPELKKQRIHFLRYTQLDPEQEEFVDQYFHNHMLPFVQPVLLIQKKIRPFLNNAALYLIAALIDDEKNPPERAYAIIKIPSDQLPRFVQLPDRGKNRYLIMLDEVVRRSIPWLFPGYTLLDSWSIKLTRDAELYIDDEFSGDLVQKIRKSLTKRNIGPASRLVYDRSMDGQTLQFLRDMFELEGRDLFPEGRYHNNMDFFSFPDFGMDQLKLKALTPIPPEPIASATDIFSCIRSADRLMHPPYHSFEPVVVFFEQAAIDPQVRKIRLIQYRVGNRSRIMDALKRAVSFGKDVAVFIEVKARFDEEENLRWGEELEKAGVKVHYSFPGLKVHAKLAMVERDEESGVTRYAYLSTGNFNESTVRVYSDLGLFTSKTELSDEVARIFSFLETVQIPEEPFKKLLVGQFNMVRVLHECIEREIDHARKGLPCGIDLKLNSLQDPEIIDHLYQASIAGVPIRLIVRGICCLVPGQKGLSENIRAISIVDRFLEHSRILIFHNSGESQVYLSSADWMSRNLHYRIETAFPLFDPAIRRTVLDLFEIQWNDNYKARIIDRFLTNRLIANENIKPFRSQHETYRYLSGETKRV